MVQETIDRTGQQWKLGHHDDCAAVIFLRLIKKSDKGLKRAMDVHYSQPKGFVGRSICYAVEYKNIIYGYIVGGSCTKHLPNRDLFCMINRIEISLNNFVNNIFFHISGPYPIRNFAQKVLRTYRCRIELDWFVKYGDVVSLHETLVEPPRSGEVYRRDKWVKCGLTKGFTCKRTNGNGTDSWGGSRVWDKINLRPKHVFYRASRL